MRRHSLLTGIEEVSSRPVRPDVGDDPVEATVRGMAG
jgi:hypothetical protein